MNATIHVTQKENDKYFNQKLPTFKNGFCKITRKVQIVPDPDGVYSDGEFGFFTYFGKKIYVCGSDPKSFEISITQPKS